MQTFIKPYLHPAFLICVTVLAVAGASKKFTIEWSGAQLTKEAIPLKKPLDLISETALMPYKVIHTTKIDNKDILEQLGTEEYIQWELEDTEVDKSSTARHCSLFITYYTGNPDRVPHIPDECYVGAGNRRVGIETLTLIVKGLEDSDDNAKTNGGKDLNVRNVIFASKSLNMWESGSKFSRLYFFHANGEYASNRTETRSIIGKNLFGKYSYFSKVEWQFSGSGFGGKIHPNKEETIKASEKFLSILLPVLEHDHWPDWNKGNR